MSRRSTRRHSSNETSGYENNNILHGKRGRVSNYVSNASLNTRRQKELLRTSSSIQPKCVDFGPYREELFPDHFFCSNCKLWDNRCPENKRLHQSMKKYQCMAGHHSFNYPTTRKNIWCRETTSGIIRKKKKKRLGDIEISSGSSTDESDHCNGEELLSLRSELDEKNIIIDTHKTTIRKHRAEINTLKEENLSLVGEIDYLESEGVKKDAQMENLRSEKRKIWNRIQTLKKKQDKLECHMTYGKPASLTDGVRDAMEFLISNFYPRYCPRRLGVEIAKCCWEFRDGIAQFSLLGHAMQYMKEYVYTPQNIVQALDNNGGVCNLRAYEVIRSVEITTEHPLKDYGKRNKTMLPNEKKIRLALYRLNEYANCILPMKHYLTTNGECIEYKDIVKFTKLLFKAFNLDEAAKNRSIDIALTLDGSSLTNNLLFVMAGIKMIDIAARDPRTGKYKLKPVNDKNFVQQSRTDCFPFKFCMGKETATMYQEEFREMFDIFNKASKDGQTIFQDWKKLNFSSPADMAAIQKCLGIGGAAKVMKFFCHCCPITSREISTPNTGDNICEECRKKERSCPGWKCYHRSMSTADQKKKFEDALEELKNRWQLDMQRVDSEGKLKIIGSQYQNSIDYIPATMEESLQCMANVMHELNIRGRATAEKSLAVMRHEVKECLEAENEMRQLIEQIQNTDTRAEAMERIIQYVPCIMHCENRISIKILTMLLIEGLSNSQGNKLGYCPQLSRKKREDIYIEKVNKIVSGDLLGSAGNEAQWKVPVVSNNGVQGKQIGTVSIENYRGRKIMDGLEQLIEISIVDISDDNRKAKWKQAVDNYRKAMSIMRKKGEDYTREELALYWFHADGFFQVWVDLHGTHGQTNYIHMIGSGHMYEYMTKWGNLNRYSQQGWEALNALIKLFFFRRTNKGGNNSGGKGLKSKLIPIAKLIQRRFFWICNLVPDDLWTTDFKMPVTTDFNILSDETEDVIFDTDDLATQSKQV